MRKQRKITYLDAIPLENSLAEFHCHASDENLQIVSTNFSIDYTQVAVQLESNLIYARGPHQHAKTIHEPMRNNKRSNAMEYARARYVGRYLTVGNADASRFRFDLKPISRTAPSIGTPVR